MGVLGECTPTHPFLSPPAELNKPTDVVGAAAIRGAFGILPAYGNNGKCTQANDRFKATISLGPAPRIGRLSPVGALLPVSTHKRHPDFYIADVRGLTQSSCQHARGSSWKS
jgi:hypothetical protein